MAEFEVARNHFVICIIWRTYGVNFMLVSSTEVFPQICSLSSSAICNKNLITFVRENVNWCTCRENCYHCVIEMLTEDNLKLPSLQDRLRDSRLTLMYKVVEEHVLAIN